MVEQLPDRSFAGPGLRAALFLFRQPFVLIPAIVGAIGWAWFLTNAVLANGKGSVQTLATMAAISVVCGFGMAVLTGLPGFLAYRLFTNPKPVWTPADGEQTIETVAANHFIGDEARGGKLYVTAQRLAFLPHRLNVKLDRVDIPLSEITSIGWRRIVRAGSVLSNTLEIARADRCDVFVVHDACSLATRIASLMR